MEYAESSFHLLTPDLVETATLIASVQPVTEGHSPGTKI